MKGVADTSWEAFKRVNVDCAENLFEACAKHNVPVLFISTVDAIGMVKGLITPKTELNSISNYAKVIAEEKAEGRAKYVLRIPRWMVVCGYHCIKLVFGNSNKTYLVFKALWPFRTQE